MNVNATNEMIGKVRRLGRKVRGGKATPAEDAAFERIDRALSYIASRKQRGIYYNAWYELPMFRWAWEGDARDNESRRY